jgi:fructokinase
MLSSRLQAALLIHLGVLTATRSQLGSPIGRGSALLSCHRGVPVIIAPVSKIYGGVETGGTWCVCALGTGPDDIRALEKFPPTGSPEETLERIVSFFAAHDAPAAIGIGSFGPVDVDRDSPTLGARDDHPEARLAEDAGGDGHPGPPTGAGRIRARRHGGSTGRTPLGAGRGSPSLCYLTVGTGIGAGLLINGQPLHGPVHPEVGHVRIPHDRRRDPFDGSCPVHGDCWEGLASGPAIAKRWGASPADLPEDHPAWPLEAEYVTLGILSIVLVASPHKVIAGGGVMQNSALLAMVRVRLRELVAGYLDTPTLGADVDRYVVGPALGDEAGVLGAIALAQLIE